MTNMNTPDETTTTPMPCGCKVDRESDEIISPCARHACHPSMRFAEVDRLVAELIKFKESRGEPVVYGDSPKAYGGSKYREIGPRFDSKRTQPKE